MLVVRVKRNREDEPAESLCIVEDNTNKRKKLEIDNLSRQLEGLGGDAKIIEESKKVIVHRVTTISNTDRSSIDKVTFEALTESVKRSFEDRDSTRVVKRAKVLVTQSKKSLVVDGKDPFIVLDMMQMYNQQQGSVPTPSSVPTNGGEIKRTPVKILDPTTRLLDNGITKAIQRADFNDISSALIQGGNPNYQQPIEKGGYTILMAAAFKLNLRMVKRVLSYDVNVLATNKDGQTALDLVKDNKLNQETCQEIRQLLQTAMIKAYQKSYSNPMSDSQNTNNQDNFVIDIYCIKTDQDSNDQEEITGQSTNETSKMDVSNNNPSSMVFVEGLRIADDGNVELIDYDSDWSDLADDEDPDSNDERHYANDYPDESDEEGGGKLFRDEDEASDDEDMYHIRAQRRGFEEADEDEAEIELNQYLQEGSSNVPFFDRSSSIGRVVRPVYDESTSAFRHDTKSLQKLYGEEDADEEDCNDHQDRIKGMRQRTGVAFASNPREFDSQGLPKYGHELSDDEMDSMMADSYEDIRPQRDAFAYDPEFDNESEDDS